MKKKNLTISFLLLTGVIFTSCKKEGCTDVNAKNY